MNINPKFLIYHDLIGLSARVRLASRPTSDEFFDIGTIIDESKNIVVAEKDNAVKRYPKKDYTFRFKIPKEDATDEVAEKELFLEVVGSKVIGRPENRLRNLKKRRRL